MKTWGNMSGVIWKLKIQEKNWASRNDKQNICSDKHFLSSQQHNEPYRRKIN
jgi:hypothetical protein